MLVWWCFNIWWKDVLAWLHGDALSWVRGEMYCSSMHQTLVEMMVRCLWDALKDACWDIASSICLVEKCKMKYVMLCLVRCWFQRPVVERCYGLSARSRNESISACWPVRPAARGPALEIQMAAAIIPRQMTAAAAAFVHYSTVAPAALTCFVRYWAEMVRSEMMIDVQPSQQWLYDNHEDDEDNSDDSDEDHAMLSYLYYDLLW